MSHELQRCPDCKSTVDQRGRVDYEESQTNHRTFLAPGQTAPCPSRLHDAWQASVGLIPDNPTDLAAIAHALKTERWDGRCPTCKMGTNGTRTAETFVGCSDQWHGIVGHPTNQRASDHPHAPGDVCVDTCPPLVGPGATPTDAGRVAAAAPDPTPTRPPKRRKWLLWCDLETGGLDEETCPLMEAAFVLTDLDLNEVFAKEAVFPVSDFTMLDKKVRAMHVENGLVLECLKAETTPGDLEMELVRMLEPHVSQRWNMPMEASEFAGTSTHFEPKIQWDDIYLAGSSVHFDRRWLGEKMEYLFGKLHYRQLDVSSTYLAFPKLKIDEPPKAHRAMSDIRRSIGILRGHRGLLDFLMEYQLQSGIMDRDILRFAARLQELRKNLPPLRDEADRHIIARMIEEDVTELLRQTSGALDSWEISRLCLKVGLRSLDLARASVDLSIPRSWNDDHPG